MRKTPLVLLVAPFLFASCSSGKSQNTNDRGATQGVPENVLIDNYPQPNSISTAKALWEGKEEFQDEALSFGISLWSRDRDNYLQFRKRIFVNQELALALRHAKQESVIIFFDNQFNVRAGYITINTNSSNKQIIDFLRKSVLQAKAEGIYYNKLRSDARQYGINLFASDVENYKQFKNRLLSNKKNERCFSSGKRGKSQHFLKQKVSCSTRLGGYRH